MIELPTSDNKSKFRYEGNVQTGTMIYYGKKKSHRKVTCQQYTQMLNEFKGQTVNIGTSRNNEPTGSLGEWLKKNVTKTAIASYVAPILVYEGYAEKIGRGIIQFL